MTPRIRCNNKTFMLHEIKVGCSERRWVKAMRGKMTVYDNYIFHQMKSNQLFGNQIFLTVLSPLKGTLPDTVGCFLQGISIISSVVSSTRTVLIRTLLQTAGQTEYSVIEVIVQAFKVIWPTRFQSYNSEEHLI